MAKYCEPVLKEKYFTCPLCGTLSHQTWKELYSGSPFKAIFGSQIIQIRQPTYREIDICSCMACNGETIWYKGKMIYPEESTAPHPSEDMPENVKEIYIEARGIHNKSPRATAALLRVAIEELVKLSGVKGDLNKAIGKLVKRGMPPEIQRALDVVRVIGNDAVHPTNRMDLKDDKDTVTTLFNLVNLINNFVITQSRQIDELYSHLPKEKKKGIEKRDRG